MSFFSRRSLFAALVPPASAPAMTLRRGVHGERVSLLGYGMMRLPTVDGAHANQWVPGSSNASIDQELVNAQVSRALALGVNYFDTSPVYCRGMSEEVTGRALARHPRDSYFIATKLSNFAGTARSAAASRAMFETSLKRLQTDHVDFYLLHSCGGGSDPHKEFASRFLDNGMLDWLVAQRAAGRIRNLGFSFHGSPRIWDWLMAHHKDYHWDFAQVQLNYVDWHHAREVNARNLDAARACADLAERGIPVVAMEPLLGGRLARYSETLAAPLAPLDASASLARWAFRFAGSVPNILTVLSGMTRTEHLEENAATYSPLVPLTPREREALEDAARAFTADRHIPCTGCNYCMPCPYGLDIPGVFAIWNDAVAEKRLPEDPGAPSYAAHRRRFLVDYARAIPPLRAAEHCIGCGRCTFHCPQGIDIPSEMRRIDYFVERLRR